jgi:hypothetical protein
MITSPISCIAVGTRVQVDLDGFKVNGTIINTALPLDYYVVKLDGCTKTRLFPSYKLHVIKNDQ